MEQLLLLTTTTVNRKEQATLTQEEVDMKHLVVVLSIALVAMLGFSNSAMAQQDITVYYPNGVTLSVPVESWQLEIAPKGFNTRPYHETWNPMGKLPGWGGWPGYESGCDGLVISPSQCDRQPYFSAPPAEEVEACTPEGELTLGDQSCQK